MLRDRNRCRDLLEIIAESLDVYNKASRRTTYSRLHYCFITATMRISVIDPFGLENVTYQSLNIGPNVSQLARYLRMLHGNGYTQSHKTFLDGIRAEITGHTLKDAFLSERVTQGPLSQSFTNA